MIVIASRGSMMDIGDSTSDDRENRDMSLPRIGDDREEADWLAIACAASLLYRLIREE